MDTALSCLLLRLDRASPFGRALFDSLVTRIAERRKITSNVMKYLHTGGSNTIHPSLQSNTYETDSFITSLWERLNPVSAQEPVVVEEDHSPPDDLVEFLNWSLKRDCDPAPEAFARGPIGELHQELHDFKATRVRGPKLNRIYSFLKSIQVRSGKSERSFSVSGRFLNKLRCRMGDLTVGALTLLHYYLTVRGGAFHSFYLSTKHCDNPSVSYLNSRNDMHCGNLEKRGFLTSYDMIGG